MRQLVTRKIRRFRQRECRTDMFYRSDNSLRRCSSSCQMVHTCCLRSTWRLLGPNTACRNTSTQPGHNKRRHHRIRIGFHPGRLQFTISYSRIVSSEEAYNLSFPMHDASPSGGYPEQVSRAEPMTKETRERLEKPSWSYSLRKCRECRQKSGSSRFVFNPPPINNNNTGQ